MSRLAFPSKTFLLGEYLVLATGQALLLAHQPRFVASWQPAAGLSSSPFPPESPAGRWLAAHPLEGEWSFQDPHHGKGGFGASGAEFLAVWSANQALPATDKERQEFALRAWDAARAFPGSGADIATQAFGVQEEQDFLLALSLHERELRRVPRGLGLELSLFHTGKKLATHEHLSRQPAPPLEPLAAILQEGLTALSRLNPGAFAHSIDRYGRALAQAGLLAPHSAHALASLPRNQVRAAKGCGAMGADVLLVLHEGASLTAWARENSLAEIVRLSI